ncbi:HNH endonuclease signature motif containing protein [Paraburkholderia sp. BL21I4N1]|uniref:HNH endonuclease signature motif containing protein n=1 Tax=Paraburkholderia sp. BL21I4N1 TaxID=1938801 RepID=UPI00215748F8|nr:HNH endonuclease signature motif containing protein [Paraburkholderia sp. BL21I4N1]
MALPPFGESHNRGCYAALPCCAATQFCSKVIGLTNYAITNGILLRSDIHTLFDLHLIAVDSDCRVAISRSLEWTEYAQYRGRRLLALPADQQEHPSRDSLKLHHDLLVARDKALDD